MRATASRFEIVVGSQTNSARPRISSKGTPPPSPSHHILESWLLFLLSPVTQNSPGLTVQGPWYSGKPPEASS